MFKVTLVYLSDNPGTILGWSMEFHSTMISSSNFLFLCNSLLCVIVPLARLLKPTGFHLMSLGLHSSLFLPRCNTLDTSQYYSVNTNYHLNLGKPIFSPEVSIWRTQVWGRDKDGQTLTLFSELGQQEVKRENILPLLLLLIGYSHTSSNLYVL